MILRKWSALGIAVGWVMVFVGVCYATVPSPSPTPTPPEMQNLVKNFISWEDTRLDGYEYGDQDRPSYREEYFRGSRVIVVDPNGSGDSVTVQGAVDLVPEFNNQRVKIHIRPGVYREKVVVPVTKAYISFIGNDSDVSKTVITGHSKANDLDSNGNELGTYRSASVTVSSDFFCATGITFQNTVVAVAGKQGLQAVALKVSGDKAFFYKVKIVGSQDTLLDDIGSHYYYQSHIVGSIDFIFGRGRSLFQDCLVESKADRYGAIAAHHRESANEDTGFSFVGCLIRGTGKILLGRAWGNYSRAIYSYCQIEDMITPEGWSDWNFPDRQKYKPWFLSFFVFLSSVSNKDDFDVVAELQYLESTDAREEEQIQGEE
ncbi:Pectinesterase QRT1 [Linum grandiflorum]